MFHPDDFFPNLQQRTISNTYRLGLKHEFAPDSILLGSFIYRNAQSNVDAQGLDILAANGTAPGFLSLKSLNLRTPEDAMTGELQHLFRSQYVSTQIGGSLAGVNSKLNQNFGLDPAFFPIPPFPSVVPVQTNTDHTQGVLYGYSYLKPHQTVTVTLGASGQFRSGENESQNGKPLVNPKFGLLWTPFPGTLIRLAAFQGSKRTLVTNQTIEPTQVAGFNQFYDDFNGTTAWRYGAALNQKLTQHVYLGGEGSIRDLKVPFVDGSGTFQKADWYEYQARGYLFWTPHDWIALRAEYLWDKQIRSSVFNDGSTKVDTSRVPLGVSLFHPNGVSVSFTGTFTTQIGSFTGINDDRPRSGYDNFWLLDAGLSYRLPQRYGLLTVGATNLLDKPFYFHDTDPNNALILPSRMVFAKLTLALP